MAVDLLSRVYCKHLLIALVHDWHYSYCFFDGCSLPRKKNGDVEAVDGHNFLVQNSPQQQLYHLTQFHCM